MMLIKTYKKLFALRYIRFTLILYPTVHSIHFLNDFHDKIVTILSLSNWNT